MIFACLQVREIAERLAVAWRPFVCVRGMASMGAVAVTLHGQVIPTLNVCQLSAHLLSADVVSLAAL